MKRFLKLSFVLIFIFISVNIFAQKNNTFKLKHDLTNQVVNFVDTLVRVCVLIEEFDVENISKVIINTSLSVYNTNKSFFEITTFENSVTDRKLNYCIGIFNIALVGSFNVNVEIEDLSGNKYQLQIED